MVDVLDSLSGALHLSSGAARPGDHGEGRRG